MSLAARQHATASGLFEGQPKCRRSRAACLLHVLGAPDADCISTAQVDPSPVLLLVAEHCQYLGLSDIYATPQALTCVLDKRVFFESMTKCCQLHFEL